jgi:type VI secretion system protein
MSERFMRRLASERREMDEGRSIVEHLQILLNSRQGLAVTNEDYGLPDLTDVVHMIPDGLHMIENEIREAILKFEPRLTNVRVRFVPSDDPFVMYFEISARRKDGSKKPFRVRTKMLAGNRFKVSA